MLDSAKKFRAFLLAVILLTRFFLTCFLLTIDGAITTFLFGLIQ